MIHPHVPALMSYEAIAIDVGDKDPGLTDVDARRQTMTRYGIEHGYDVYQGDHGTRVVEGGNNTSCCSSQNTLPSNEAAGG